MKGKKFLLFALLATAALITDAAELMASFSTCIHFCKGIIIVAFADNKICAQTCLCCAISLYTIFYESLHWFFIMTWFLVLWIINNLGNALRALTKDLNNFIHFFQQTCLL